MKSLFLSGKGRQMPTYAKYGKVWPICTRTVGLVGQKKWWFWEKENNMESAKAQSHSMSEVGQGTSSGASQKTSQKCTGYIGRTNKLTVEREWQLTRWTQRRTNSNWQKSEKKTKYGKCLGTMAFFEWDRSRHFVWGLCHNGHLRSVEGLKIEQQTDNTD